MRAWRIVQQRYAERALDGEGACLFGGRWNLPGTRMVYTAESLSLATLEILVNLDSPETLDRYISLPLEFDEGLCKAVDFDSLPADWAAEPAPAAIRRLGSAWAAAGESAVLVVPSAVVHNEHNFLLNPEHPDFVKIRPGRVADFRLDPRLVRSF